MAVLTGGGDCPGLNAAIRAVTRRALEHGYEVLGIRGGWKGLVDGELEPLGAREVSGILPRGGTILRSTGVDPARIEGGVERVLEHARGLQAVVAIGGEGTLATGARLHAAHGLPVVGVPKTIDNDLAGTDYTIGFDTAVEIACQAIDRLHTTAESHNRVMVVEVMGRESGWIALHAGLASGADAILIPEYPMTVEDTCSLISHRHGQGKDFSIVVVAEGWPLRFDSGEERIVAAGVDANGFVRYGGVGAALAAELEERTGYPSRVTVLGHVQRGGTPTARDRILATRLGLHGVDLAHAGRFGTMAATRGGEIVTVMLAEAIAERKGVPRDLYDVARAFFS
jgi:6-phosphofructokinase 1